MATLNLRNGVLALTLCLTLAPLAAQAADAGTTQTIVVQEGKPQLQTLPRPTPGPGQVVVHVRAAGVNPADWKRAAGGRSAAGVPPGWDIAGDISAVGSGVSAWKVGDPVIGFFEAVGGYTQYALIAADMIARKPARMSYEEASGIPLVAVTAYKALIDVAGLRSGQRVLVHGGAGGVGSAAVQIAAARGAYVITTASEKNHAYVKSIGAREAIDYNTVKFEERVRDADITLNTVDEETARRSLATLKPNGFMVTVAGAVPREQCAAARLRCGAPDRKTGTPIGQILAEIGQLADAGKFSLNVDAKFPLDRVAEAWALSSAGHTRGKIVLVLPP